MALNFRTDFSKWLETIPDRLVEQTEPRRLFEKFLMEVWHKPYEDALDIAAQISGQLLLEKDGDEEEIDTEEKPKKKVSKKTKPVSDKTQDELLDQEKETDSEEDAEKDAAEDETQDEEPEPKSEQEKGREKVIIYADYIRKLFDSKVVDSMKLTEDEKTNFVKFYRNIPEDAKKLALNPAQVNIMISVLLPIAATAYMSPEILEKVKDFLAKNEVNVSNPLHKSNVTIHEATEPKEKLVATPNPLGLNFIENLCRECEVEEAKNILTNVKELLTGFGLTVETALEHLKLKTDVKPVEPEEQEVAKEAEDVMESTTFEHGPITDIHRDIARTILSITSTKKILLENGDTVTVDIALAKRLKALFESLSNKKQYSSYLESMTYSKDGFNWVVNKAYTKEVPQ